LIKHLLLFLEQALLAAATPAIQVIVGLPSAYLHAFYDDCLIARLVPGQEAICSGATTSIGPQTPTWKSG